MPEGQFDLGPVASTSSLSLADSSNLNHSSTYLPGRHIPSHSIASTIASDADESQFQLDEMTPSRSAHGHGRGEGSGGTGTNGAGGGPVSMRSLTSNWSLREREERSLALGALTGEEDRTLTSRDT